MKSHSIDHTSGEDDDEDEEEGDAAKSPE